MIKALCIGLLSVLAAGTLRAQILWPGSAAGMPVEVVQQAFPDAHPPLTPPELPNGRGTGLLEIDQVVVAAHPFKVQFFFKDRLLAVVALTDTSEIPVKELERFRELLRAKYGQEYSTRSSEFVEITWKAVQTLVKLTWAPVGRDIATLAITYEAPIVKDPLRL